MQRNHYKLPIVKATSCLLMAVMLAVFVFAPAVTFGQASTTPFVVWVFDKSVNDSQFGYYDGVASQPVGPVYSEADIEGLACLQGSVYAVRGGDEDKPSALFTVDLNVSAGTSQLTEVGAIQTADNQTFYEVSSLVAHQDGTLWGFASGLGPNTPGRGILHINPGTGAAELIQPSSLDVAGLAWIGNVLWLAAGDELYTWTPGGAIALRFEIEGVKEIEALDAVDQLLYLAGDGLTEVMVVDSNTGVKVDGKGFLVPDDIEGLAFCQLTLSSTYSDTAPSIDGSIDYGEWQISNQLTFGHGFISARNDTTRLYLLIDLLNDTVHDTGGGLQDDYQLTFDVNRDRAITPNVDINYGTTNSNLRYQFYLGGSQWTALQPDTFSSRAVGFGCFLADNTLTPNPLGGFDCHSHRVLELAIDLSEIGAIAGDTVRMGLRVSSPNPSFVDDFPANFSNNFTFLIEVALAAPLMPLPVADPGATIHLETDAIEVTQAIQTRNNSLPLVANKQTVARTFANVDGVLTNQPALVYLYGAKNGIDLPGSPLSMLHDSPTTINRDQLDATANFSLPITWDDEGSVEFRARVRDLFGNVNGSPAFVRSFTAKEQPLYWVVPLNTGTAELPALVDDDEIEDQQSYLETVFPVPGVRFVRKEWQAVGTTTVDDAIQDLNEYYSLTQLAWAASVLSAGQQPFELPDQIYGFTPTEGGLSDPIWAGGNGRVAWGFRGTSREGTMTHEINHNLDTSTTGTWGRHVPDGCGAGGPDASWPYTSDDIQETGFDTRLPWQDGLVQDTVLANTFPDFMSYCQSGQLPTKWLSPYRWQNLFNIFPNAGATVSASVIQAEIGQVYYISGQLHKDGSGRFNPILVQPGIPTAVIKPGDYSIEIQDAAGQVLSVTPFFGSFINPEGAPVDTIYFNYQLPMQQKGEKILLRAGDQILDMIKVSANAPTVQVLTPNGGEHWDAAQVIRWAAEDLDGDPLSFTILYTPNNGHSWFPVASNVQGESLEVDTLLLPAGDQARIRVIVTDGLNTSEDDSDGTFSVTNKAPRVSIIEPDDNAEYIIDQSILFQGRATDVEDALIPESSFTWAYGSTIFGTGSEMRAILPKGTHEILLTVVDSEGNPGQDKIIITVREPYTQPALQVAPNKLRFSAIAGGTNLISQPLGIDNVGTGILGWTATASTTWLNLSALSGTAPSRIDVSVDINGLSTGTYTGNIQINAGDQSQIVPVELTVQAEPNRAPNAVDDIATTFQGVPVVVNVVANDVDPNGDTLTVTNVSLPAHGTATTDGANVTYTPALDFSGTDNFTYSISDNKGGTATATVTITVQPTTTSDIKVFLPQISR